MVYDPDNVNMEEPDMPQTADTDVISNASLLAVSHELRSLERTTQHMLIGAVHRQDPIANELMSQLKRLRRARNYLSDTNLSLAAEADRLISAFDDAQVTIGRLTSDLYAFKNKFQV